MTVYEYLQSGGTTLKIIPRLVSNNITKVFGEFGVVLTPALPLKLSWSDISGVPVLDPSSVDEWNILFDLPAKGAPFLKAIVVGNDVTLIGGSNITWVDGYSDVNINFGGNQSLIAVEDSGCIIACGDSSFVECTNLTSVILPNATVIGENTFGICENLTSVTLPALEIAGNYSFSSCYSLVEISLPNLVTLGENIFDTCDLLTTVDLPNVEAISDYTFNGCYSLTDVSAPIATSIGYEAFVNCSGLSVVSFPEVTTIADQAFSGCLGLTELTVPSCVVLGSSNNNDGVFLNIIGNTITLTINSMLMTVLVGEPDGDIQSLIDNNTVTIFDENGNDITPVGITNINYGALYNQYVLSDSRKITSSDEWIIPTSTQTYSLWNILGSTSQERSNNTREVGDVYWNAPNTGATNSSGFNARGSGFRVSTFSNFKGSLSYFCYVTLNVRVTNINPTQFNDNYLLNNSYDGRSIRLVRTSTTLSNGQTGTYSGNDGKTYRTICIGGLEWLADNLNETQYRNGEWVTGFNSGVYTPISNATWMAATSGMMCYQNNDINNG